VVDDRKYVLCRLRGERGGLEVAAKVVCLFGGGVSTGYSVKGVYHYLSSSVQKLDNFGSELLWH